VESKIEMSSIIIEVLSRICDDLLFLEKYFGYQPLGFFYPKIVIPNNILDINPFRISLSKYKW
jgi:hypothetical protein